MGINLDKPHLWKQDIIQSVDLYNTWFMDFAPKAFRETRVSTAKTVEKALKETNYLNNISPTILQKHPEVLPILRMSTCPPIARDRLVGLAGVSKSLVQNMEDAKNPPHLIRNAQEKRQLAAITELLESKGYSFAKNGVQYNEMPPGSFSFHTNVPVYVAGKQGDTVNIPVDVAIMPLSANVDDMPILLEAKSAGDFTNVNKRRKEEAVKMQQLKNTYGDSISYSLFLCGYFDSGYLGYEAAEGIDWIWEHRINDIEQLGI